METDTHISTCNCETIAPNTKGVNNEHLHSCQACKERDQNGRNVFFSDFWIGHVVFQKMHCGFKDMWVHVGDYGRRFEYYSDTKDVRVLLSTLVFLFQTGLN